jgi:hypothetical protein
MIKAVIIDDEPAMQEVNSQMLREFFPLFIWPEQATRYQMHLT